MEEEMGLGFRWHQYVVTAYLKEADPRESVANRLVQAAMAHLQMTQAAGSLN